MTDKAKARTKPVKKRSPSYPSIDLGSALGRAHKILEHFEDHPMPVADVIGVMGYSAKSGTGLGAFSALVKFGLVAKIGRGKGGKARLSANALRVLRDQREDQTERRALLRELALQPDVHREIYEKYGVDPKPDLFRHYLVVERGFTQKGAEDLMEEYSATMEFANFGDDGEPAGEGDSEADSAEKRAHGAGDGGGSGLRHTADSRAEEVRDLLIPITKKRTIVVQAPTDLSAQDFEYLVKYLETFKDVIVSAPEDTTE